AMQATAAGTPVTWTAPSEGAMGYAHYIAIAEGAPNREDAERLVNLILSPEYQKIMAQTDFMAPANTETELDADFAATFPVTAEAMAAATPIPWQAYETHRIRLNERWQREIER